MNIQWIGHQKDGPHAIERTAIFDLFEARKEKVLRGTTIVPNFPGVEACFQALPAGLLSR